MQALQYAAKGEAVNDSDIRRLLGENAAHTARATRQGTVIRQKASEALDATQAGLAGVSPAEALLDEGKGAAYQRMVADRARLSTMLGLPTSGG